MCQYENFNSSDITNVFAPQCNKIKQSLCTMKNQRLSALAQDKEFCLIRISLDETDKAEHKKSPTVRRQ
jgi:hypothetical protein